MTSETLQTKLDKLPEHLKKEVLDYIEFLIQKYNLSLEKEAFLFDWEGALSELKGDYTSVKLQHQASKWR